MTENNQELVLTRTVDARPATVFRAFTDPDLVARWWVPEDERLAVEVLEARAGGSRRFVNTEADGSTCAFHAVFHAVEPTRIVQTRVRRDARRRAAGRLSRSGGAGPGWSGRRARAG